MKQTLLSFGLLLGGLSAVAQTPGEDLTAKIVNPQFSDDTSGWTVLEGKMERKGATDNKVITAYNYTFDVSQTITDLPNGTYRVKVQGFTRPLQHNELQAAIEAGTVPANQSWLYANDARVNLMRIYDEKITDSKVGDAFGEYFLPNSSNQTSAAFSAGYYDKNEVLCLVTDGTLCIGICQKSKEGTPYVGYDNFRLQYVADGVAPEIVQEAVQVARNEAQKLGVTDAFETVVEEILKDFDGNLAAWADVQVALQTAPVKAYMADKKAGDDITALIQNPGFDNNTTEGWNITGGLSAKNHVARAFEDNYDASQTLSGLPAGTYKLSLQAFGRGVSNADLVAALREGNELPANQTVIYANDQTLNALQVTAQSLTTEQKGAGNWTEMPDGTWIPDNASSTEVAFAAGLYKTELLVTVGEDGILEFGMRMSGDHSGRYSALDNVTLSVEQLEGTPDTPDVPTVDADLVEITQDQGKQYDTFTRCDFTPGEAYNTYVAHGDLNIAMKMMDLDVSGCDYVVVKFAEPVKSGWHLAFWSNQDLVDVPEGCTEFKYVFAEDSKCGVTPLTNGIAGKGAKLPQICMMTFFGGFQAPLEAKVIGVYKHVADTPTAIRTVGSSDNRVAKFLKDGRVVLVKGGKLYDLTGKLLK